MIALDVGVKICEPTAHFSQISKFSALLRLQIYLSGVTDKLDIERLNIPLTAPMTAGSCTVKRRIASDACRATMMIHLFCCSAHADPAESESPISTIIQRLTNGGSRKDLFDIIERNDTERDHQLAQRKVLEAEIRAIATNIDETIFAIRLNIAEIRSGSSACRQQRDRTVTLVAQAADLDRLADSARMRCLKAGIDSSAVAQLCQTRLKDIAREKAAVASEQAAVAQACVDTRKEEP